MKKSVFVIIFLFAYATVIAQNVGFGTTTPFSRLHVNGTSWFQGDNTPLISFAGAGIGIGFPAGSTGGYIFAWNYGNNTARNLWLQHTGGNVIIGSFTNTPFGKVDINSTGMRAIYAVTNSGEALYGSTSNGNAITGVSSTALGMHAVSNSTANAGLLAEGYIGLQGTNKGSDGNRQAVRGENSANAGGYAGLFNGGVTWVAGILQKNAGAFYIDHPVEPETKFLVHSFVESPDMKNIYDGVVTTNSSGLAVVTMPSWFQALNMDFRYQLTCIGQFAQAIVESEIANNAFLIRTDKPNTKVSWQVTGTRNDPFARDHRLPVEKLKTGEDIGHYIYPQGYGKPAAFSLNILKPTNLAGIITSEPAK